MSHLSWKIGDVRITRFAEPETPTKLTTLLSEATPESIEPHASWLSRHFLESDDMAAAGFAREQIDLVLCTHLHLDHVG